jgi:lipopolysaccharide transport protein LptA
MAASNPSNRLRLALSTIGLIALGPVAWGADAPNFKSTEDIHLHASSSEIDQPRGRMVYRDVTISQGPLSIAAKEANATSLDFKSGQWNFKGDVHIVMPNGKLDAETATVNFANNQISRAQATGSPATFESQRKGADQIAHGKAGAIEYDVAQETVRLTHSAWLSDGSNDISGDTLVYDIRGQKVVGNPDQRDQRGIDITIRPRSNSGNSQSEPEPSARPKAPESGA